MLPYPHSVFSQADSPVVTVVLAEAFCKAFCKLIQPGKRSRREQETRARWVLCAACTQSWGSSQVKSSLRNQRVWDMFDTFRLWPLLLGSCRRV